MNIVGFLLAAPPLRIVGGEMMTLKLLANSAARGHSVSVVIQTLDEPRYFNGVMLIPGNVVTNQLALRALNRADVLVTHPEIAADAHKYTARIGRVPHVGIVHNLNPATLTAIKQRPRMHLVVNSTVTATALANRAPTLIYPPVEAPEPPVPGLPRAFATVVNLSAAKGARVVQGLVEYLPDVPFLGVLGGHGWQEPPGPEHANLTLFGHVGGLGLPFGLTRLFLAPSRDETYGMTVCEAIMAGIPVLASDIPAHREALGDGAIYLPVDSPLAWVEPVRHIMTNQNALDEARKQVHAHQQVLTERLDETYQRWELLLSSL